MVSSCSSPVTRPLPRMSTTGRATRMTTLRWTTESRPIRSVHLFRRANIHKLQKLHSRPGVLPECPGHPARHHGYSAFVDATRSHALVSGIDDDTHATGLQHAVDAVGDFGCQLFLNLEAARITLHHARELAD